MALRFDRSSGFCLVVVSFLMISALSLQSAAQTFPSKIRGYKVHRADISIGVDRADTSENNSDVVVSFGDPVVSGISLTGATFDVDAAITPFDQSGTIDFISFEDFRINGIEIEITEFTGPFSFSKGQTTEISAPIKVFVSSLAGAKAAAQELRESENKWRITGTAFVFGKFKKSIFKFKRVIPVDIDLTIDKPSIKIPYISK
ncbi:MAG: hypothetical protein R2681_01875 [Pyrinomonadaceae bacterium]